MTGFQKKVFFFVFVSTLVLKLIFFGNIENIKGLMDGDTSSYRNPAIGLVNHGSFCSEVKTTSETKCIPETFRMPGYPYFLSLFIDKENSNDSDNVFRRVSLVQILLCHLGVAFFLWTLALIPSFNFLWVLLGFLVPSLTIYSAYILSEGVFIFLWMLYLSSILGVIFNLWKNKSFSLIGVVLTVALIAYVRPQTLHLFYMSSFIFLAGAIFLKKRIGYVVVVAHILGFCTLVPWMQRNHSIGGSTDLTSQLGPSLATSQISLARAWEKNISYHEAKSEIESEFSGYDESSAVDQFKRSRDMMSFTIDYAKAHPFMVLRANFVGFPKLLFDAGIYEFFRVFGLVKKDQGILSRFEVESKFVLMKELIKSQGLSLLGLGLGAVLMGYLWFGAFFGLRDLWKKEEYIAVFLSLAFCAVVFGLYSSVYAYARYRLPLEPLLIFLNGARITKA